MWTNTNFLGLLFDTKLKELQNALITSSNAKAMSIFYDILDNLGEKSKKGNEKEFRLQIFLQAE